MDTADQVAGIEELLRQNRYPVKTTQERVRGHLDTWRQVTMFQLSGYPPTGCRHWSPVRVLVARGVTKEWLESLDQWSDQPAALSAVLCSRLRARHLQGWAALGVRPKELAATGRWTVPVADAALALTSAAVEMPGGPSFDGLSPTCPRASTFDLGMVKRSHELAVFGLRLGLARNRFGDVARAGLAGSPLDLTVNRSAARAVFADWVGWWDLLGPASAGWQRAGYSLPEARTLLALPENDLRRPGPDQLVAMAALRGPDD